MKQFPYELAEFNSLLDGDIKPDDMPHETILTIQGLLGRLEKIRDMEKFIQELWNENAGFMEVSFMDIQDKLLKFGLLDIEPYSISEHGTSFRDESDAEEGDPLYFVNCK